MIYNQSLIIFNESIGVNKWLLKHDWLVDWILANHENFFMQLDIDAFKNYIIRLLKLLVLL